MSSVVPVSVVIIAKNEEEKIEECLQAVHGWAAEIIVVDDYSTDTTLDIVKRFTDRFFQRRMDIEGVHRNWAYSKATQEWVLSIDADEIVTDELKEEITEILKNDPPHVAFSIPLRNYIGKHWVRFGGWYPAPKTRFCKKDKFRYEEVDVHPRLFIDGTCGHLTKDIIHKGYNDIAEFMNSVNGQTTLEARKWVRTGRTMSFAHALRRTLDRFFRSYVRKKAYKDGNYGLVVALFASFYQILSYVKYREMKETFDNEM